MSDPALPGAAAERAPADGAAAPLRAHPPGRAARELLWNLIARELKARYKGSVLGFLWTLLTPLFMAVIYVVFLRLLAGRGVPIEEIIIGVFAWTFTVQSVTGGLTAVTGNANLVKKVRFPRVLLPMANTAANLISYLLTLVVQFALIAVLLAWKGEAIRAGALAVPGLIALHTAFNLALALLLSAANVYFRDTQHLVGVGLSAWFFLSPAMYNLEFIRPWTASRPWLMDLYLLNPLAPLLTGYRALMLGAPFEWRAAAALGLLWPLGLLALALAVFRRAQRNFADWL